MVGSGGSEIRVIGSGSNLCGWMFDVRKVGWQELAGSLEWEIIVGRKLVDRK